MATDLRAPTTGPKKKTKKRRIKRPRRSQDERYQDAVDLYIAGKAHFPIDMPEC